MQTKQKTKQLPVYFCYRYGTSSDNYFTKKANTKKKSNERVEKRKLNCKFTLIYKKEKIVPVPLIS